MASEAETKPQQQKKPVKLIIWAIIGPLLGFALSQFGGQVVTRYSPAVLDKAGNRVGLGPLNVSTQWPGPMCDGASLGSYPAPAPPVGKYLSNQMDWEGQPIVDLTAAGGRPYQEGVLTLVLSAKAGETAVITDIEPQDYTKDTRPQAWIIAPATQCGGGPTSYRRYKLNLDSVRPTLAQIRNSGKVVNKAGFSPFNASDSNPTVVRVTVSTCKANFAFSLSIKYQVSGNDYTYHVGTAAQPLRIAGTPIATTTRLYSDATPSGNILWHTATPSEIQKQDVNC